jgi:NAD kinase
MEDLKFKLVIDRYAKITYQKLEQIMKGLGVRISDTYDFVLIVGGDGTLLRNAPLFVDSTILLIEEPKSSEYKSRGVIVKHKFSELYHLVKMLHRGTYTIKEEPLLEINYMSKRYLSAGDFFVERCNTSNALRYTIKVHSSISTIESYGISNGFIVSTPLGATGYYSYIEVLNKKPPKRIKGIGIAHILPTFVSDKVDGMPVKYRVRRVVPFDSNVKVKIDRNTRAYLNMPGHRSVLAKPSSVFNFKISNKSLHIIE